MKKFTKISFENRHIGPSNEDILKMLQIIGIESLDKLIGQIIPADIRLNKPLSLDLVKDETEILKLCHEYGLKSNNHSWRNYIGMGFYNCHVPTPIIRNVLENPGWYTSYTPYQSEISQGRLECLFNFQTMITELTGLCVSNCSLLDEASAAAEALTMTYRLNKRLKYLLYDRCHPQTIEVVKTRAKFLGIEIIQIENLSQAFKPLADKSVGGLMVQSPDTRGEIAPNLGELCSVAHKNGSIVSLGTDLLANCVTQPPSYFNVDIAFGSCQRMGNFLGFGGPHAAFFASKRDYLRQMPGRIVGLSKDTEGNKAYRLMLQTREQHIKREKATSNICTSQALLANMTALYGIYHGPLNLRSIALNVHENTKYLKSALQNAGHSIENQYFFDTLNVKPNSNTDCIRDLARAKQINLRYLKDNSVGISLDETTQFGDVIDLIDIFNHDNKGLKKQNRVTDIEYFNLADHENLSHQILEGYTDTLKYPRSLKFMNQAVFNKYHTETEFVRYVKSLENKDMSLTNTMIPLGSCTLKLNATTQLMPISWPCFANVHPYAPLKQTRGYLELIEDLEKDLCEITGMDAVSFQSNSGAQGEYSGLCVIASYLNDLEGGGSFGKSKRKICFIPTSAHGTNFASAVLAGYTIVALKTDRDGYLDLKDFEESLKRYGPELACLMITYPSTHGTFDPNIKTICQKIHDNGGLVYMDGANMNAQIGLCRPGDFGADVCHLNLHKTFCIPHGGGGPGMGPIAVKSHLIPHLPKLDVKSDDEEGTVPPSIESFGSISSSKYGSALILLIPWIYIKTMGSQGLTNASKCAILNANYIMYRLQPYYHIYGVENADIPAEKKGTRRCGHEFLLDLSQFKARYGIEPMDVAKRILDYNFHSPTVSFPVSTCLMIEPTESENLLELDRFCDAMISIRRELDDIGRGIYTKDNNPIKNAPHPETKVISENWDVPYSRQVAAYPNGKCRNKIWPSVSRVDEIYGDQNPCCKL